MAFDEESEAVVCRPAIGGVQPVGGVLAGLGEHAPATFGRDRRRDHVERAANRVRPLRDGGGALEDLESCHAPRGGEVVGGRCRVGCRGDQHAVFKQRDAAAALGRDAADADVRPQSEAVLHLNRHTGYLAHDALYVGMRETFDFLGADEMRRTSHALDIVAGADNGHFFDEARFVETVLCAGRDCHHHQCRERNASCHTLFRVELREGGKPNANANYSQLFFERVLARWVGVYGRRDGW